MAAKGTKSTTERSSVTLSTLAPARGAKKRRKRIGFGSGSGSGKTAGKGHKGQTARAGGAIPRGFEGGQMPLHRRLPKRGFTSRKRVRGDNVFSLVTLDDIVALGEKQVSVELLKSKGLVARSSRKVKILGGKTSEPAQVKQAIAVEVDAISAAAKQAIEAAGGSVTLR